MPSVPRDLLRATDPSSSAILYTPRDMSPFQNHFQITHRLHYDLVRVASTTPSYSLHYACVYHAYIRIIRERILYRFRDRFTIRCIYRNFTMIENTSDE